MTEDERKKLNETHAMTVRLHEQLFGVPPQGGEPLMVRMARMVEMLETGGVMGKWFLRGVMTLAGLGVALAQIKGWQIWR